jgi:peptide/nickel transport system substrate-binding protein
LTVAIQREPVSFEPELSGAAGSSTAGGASQVRPIVQDYLVAPTPGGGREARIAVAKPTIADGSWKVNPDGTMELTWKLRPNVKWHDGTAFTSADVAFGFEVRQDPTLARLGSGGGRPELMESVTATDPQTVLVRWKQVYVRADEAEGIEPLPRHLLGDLYRTDKEGMTQSRYFSTEFVGLGAYKLTRWEQGSHIEFARNDDYYLGRPNFDRLFVRFVTDPNTMVANILAGTVDVLLPPAVDMEAALDVRRQWEGTGNNVRVDVLNGMEQLEIQHRAEYARPRAGLNRAARQGLYTAIDRQTLSEIITQGAAPIADSWYAPNDPVRKDVEPFIPQFRYDPARAQQLLAQAGWTKGSDGILVHQPSGERFEIEIMHRPDSGAVKEATIIADNWKAVGAQVGFNQLTPQTLSDRQMQATRPGPYITSPSGNNFYDHRLHSDAIARAETRWTGTNRGGYNNQRVDDVLDKLAVTIEPRARIDLHHQLLDEQMVDIAVMPLFWEVVPILMLQGITGPQMALNEATHNVWQWDRK